MTRPGAYIRETADHVVVERLLAGHRVPYRTADRHEVIRRMVALGYHDGQIAHVLQCPRTSVHRTRGRTLGLPPVIDPATGRNFGPQDAPTRPRDRR